MELKTIILCFCVLVIEGGGGALAKNAPGVDNGYNAQYKDLTCPTNDAPGYKDNIMFNNETEFKNGCRKSEYVEMTDKLKSMLLNLHNFYRSEHALGKKRTEKISSTLFDDEVAEMVTMRWDPELELMALQNAVQCKMNHDHCRRTKRYIWAGQNLGVLCHDKDQAVEPVVGYLFSMWYNEYKLLQNLGSIGAFVENPKNTDGTKFWGHFHQVVMDRAFAVGCSVIKDRPIVKGKENICYHLACNYALENIYGLPIYKTGQLGSKCKVPFKMNPKYKGLCHPDQEYSSAVHTISQGGEELELDLFTEDKSMSPPVTKWLAKGKKGPVWKATSKL